MRDVQGKSKYPSENRYGGGRRSHNRDQFDLSSKSYENFTGVRPNGSDSTNFNTAPVSLVRLAPAHQIAFATKSIYQIEMVGGPSSTLLSVHRLSGGSTALSDDPICSAIRQNYGIAFNSYPRPTPTRRPAAPDDARRAAVGSGRPEYGKWPKSRRRCERYLCFTRGVQQQCGLDHTGFRAPSTAGSNLDMAKDNPSPAPTPAPAKLPRWQTCGCSPWNTKSCCRPQFLPWFTGFGIWHDKLALSPPYSYPDLV